MADFTYDSLPGRVVFGVGCIDRLGDEVAKLGAKRALVVSTPSGKARAEAASQHLAGKIAGLHAGAVMHVPVATARAAVDEARRVDADCVVAIGGGSPIGLAKAIALELGLPIVAVPTTYAGSEMTPYYGLTEGGLKRTGRDARVLPRTTIYDPALTVDLPPRTSAASGMNAIAHAVEALYAADRNPLVSRLAEAAIRDLASSLPIVVRAPKNLEARSTALNGAWLASGTLGAVGMALHHKLCHTLGGTFNLPHAETHAVVLPHAAAYNAKAAPEAMTAVAQALGAPEAATGLHDLARTIGAPLSLRDLGLRESDLDRAAALALTHPYPNPRPLAETAIRALLDDAFHGRRPRV